MLEQKKRNINKTGFEYVLSMAKVIGCGGRICMRVIMDKPKITARF